VTKIVRIEDVEPPIWGELPEASPDGTHVAVELETFRRLHRRLELYREIAKAAAPFLAYAELTLSERAFGYKTATSALRLLDEARELEP
jgi:hypothetical protein